MKPMYGIHEVLRHSLLEINNRCQSLWQDMTKFVHDVSTVPAAMVKIRLSRMSLRITMQTSRLYYRHEGKGVVLVIMTDTELSVHWVEKEFSIEAKEDLKRKGFPLLSPEEILKMIELLSDGVDSEQCAEAVEWINQYEPSLVLDVQEKSEARNENRC